MSENAVTLEVDKSKARCFSLVIHTASGRQILFPEVAPYDPATMRGLTSRSVTQFLQVLGAAFVSDPSGEIVRHVVEAAEAALDIPEFVEALKARGAVVLGPGETMGEENP